MTYPEYPFSFSQNKEMKNEYSGYAIIEKRYISLRNLFLKKYFFYIKNSFFLKDDISRILIIYFGE